MSDSLSLPPILFIMGAGASVSSGLRTYRGNNGLYPENIESILCPTMLTSNPHRVWEEIRNTIMKSQPTQVGKTYHTLAQIAKHSPDSLFLTQNVDGLIYKTGIPASRIWEIHGHLRTMTCMKCKKSSPLCIENPVCACGGVCRPNVVLFGEGIHTPMYDWVLEEIKRIKPQYVVLIGTTLTFQYLKMFIYMAQTQREDMQVININPDPQSKIPGYTHFLLNSDEGLDYLWEKLYEINI